jgi:predicted nucleic acid-binding protein
MNKIAIDTNILVYLYDSLDYKKAIADKILNQSPIIPVQVVSEYLNVSKRLLLIPKIELLQKCNEVFKKGIIAPTTQLTLEKAAYLISKYDFQLFDAIIIATA